MNDGTPIFTDDDSVNEEIAENERRDSEEHTPQWERTIDKVVAPVTRVLEDPDLTPEEKAEVARQNDREYHNEE